MATLINFPVLPEVNYPVTSVNGMTGAVTINIPVESVNGKTGAITLSASDIGALPNTYVAPVTSVNGKTGAVTISIPNIVYSYSQPTGSEGMIWLKPVS